jgi:GntR family transcriptional regulator
VTKVDAVCESILARIEAGALHGGDRLPSEAELAHDHGVSVGTVQKALARLAQDGIVSREHGRGTFVRGSRLDTDGVAFLRFRDPRGRELPTYVHVASVRRDARTGAWSDFLGGGPCIRITRRIDVDGRFALHGDFWLRTGDFEQLAAPDPRALESNLRLLIGRRLGRPTLRVDQRIRFTPPPARVAAALGIAAGTAGLAMDIRGFTLRDRPLWFQRVHAPPFSDELMILR